MFFKVMNTFLLFLGMSLFLVVAFGFAFYIILHDDINEGKYENPLLAIAMTSTLFVGQLEFGDIPINDLYIIAGKLIKDTRTNHIAWNKYL